MFVWAAISYQLQEHIHRIWMNMVHLLIQWLPYLVICRGDPLVNFKLSSLMMKNVVQNWAIWETHFFPQSWSKSYPEPKTQDPKPPILNMHSDFKTPWTTKIQNFDASPPKKNRLIKMFVWQGPAPNLDLGPFGPQTQNPEPKTIEVLLFWGCPKIFLSLLSIFLPSPNSPIDRRKNVQSAGFHTCFWYGNIVVPMVFALDHVVHSKHFYPKYSKFFFPSTSEGLNKWYSI